MRPSGNISHGTIANEDGQHYDVFVRTWWKANPSWPNGLEPHLGPKVYIARKVTETEARSIAQDWNKSHRPGKLSRKAEFEER